MIVDALVTVIGRRCFRRKRSVVAFVGSCRLWLLSEAVVGGFCWKCFFGDLVDSNPEMVIELS